MSYDPNQFKLVTVTEDYFTVWSAVSGVETRRYKNPKEESLRDVCFMNHSYYFPNNFLLHTRNMEILAVDS